MKTPKPKVRARRTAKAKRPGVDTPWLAAFIGMKADYHDGQTWRRNAEIVGADGEVIKVRDSITKKVETVTAGRVMLRAETILEHLEISPRHEALRAFRRKMVEHLDAMPATNASGPKPLRYIDRFRISDPGAFAVELRGDGLADDVQDGDTLIFTPVNPVDFTTLRDGITVRSGAVVWVHLKETDPVWGGKDNVGFLTRAGDGYAWLTWNGGRFPPHLLTPDEIELMGSVIEFRRPFLPNSHDIPIYSAKSESIGAIVAA